MTGPVLTRREAGVMLAIAAFLLFISGVLLGALIQTIF